MELLGVHELSDTIHVTKPVLLDADRQVVNVGDTIVTFRRANPAKHWWLKDGGILRKFVVAEIHLMKDSIFDSHWNYFTWLSEPVKLKDGREFVASGNSRKYKRMKYMIKHGVISPWIIKV